MSRYDDAMDAFGMHAVGGMAGGILTGFFANDFVSGSETKKGVFYGRGVQLGIQIYAIVVVAGWSFFMSSIILIIISKTMGVRVSGQSSHDSHTLYHFDYMHIRICSNCLLSKLPWLASLAPAILVMSRCSTLQTQYASMCTLS